MMTDGDRALEEKVRAWTEANLSRVNVEYPVSNHIDEMLDRQIERSEMIRLSIRAFGVLIDEQKRLGMPAQPRLVIPLKDSDNLYGPVPTNMVDIEHLWDSWEPPSLYLLDWSRGRYLYIYEEYKRPLTFNPTGVQGVYIYLMVFRDIEGIKENQRFTRVICADYYPSGQRIGWSDLSLLYDSGEDSSPG